MGGFSSSIFNPYEVPQFLQSDTLIDIARSQKISIRYHDVGLPCPRKLDDNQMESIDLSDESEFEITIELSGMRFPIHREFKTCLFFMKRGTRKVISCTGKEFKSVCEWINKHREDYNETRSQDDNYNRVFVYCKKGGHQYISAINFDTENRKDRFLLVWARRIIYGKDRTADHVPVILREYRDFKDRFDAYVCLPDRCLFLHQRKLCVNLHAKRHVDNPPSRESQSPRDGKLEQ
jgi:hypothetical protein